MIVLSVLRYLVCIHADHGNLDGSIKVEVVVAEVIGASLELVLGQLRCIVGDLEEHRLGSSHSRLMRDHVEIEDSVALLLHERDVDHRTCARVDVGMLVVSVEESVLNVPVNKTVDNLGLVPCLLSLQGV